MKPLYPEISPYNTFFLESNSQHAVYIEESGIVEGIPVIFLHGGPCSGTKPDHRRFFNPEKYRIILMDQRGCGLSTPYGELENNTTQDLIDDMELIREQLGIEQWLLFGGSWGGTLALLYAQQHTEKVSALIIRGIFLARQKDLDWFIKDGAGRIYPECWQNLVASIEEDNSDNLVADLWKALWSENELTQRRAAKAWAAWGSQVSLGTDYQKIAEVEHASEKMLKQVRMEIHYAKNNYFIDENQILDQCDKLADIPTIIIHGRNDLVCPMDSAMALHQALPEAQYIVLANSGHIAQGEEMVDALIAATNNMAKILS
ncbi:MAG: prolyl aminopeptidase [Methylococcaceae bacterium]|nr:prolyl aminopeptidase [Methylococcaceae bacterium]